MDDDKESTLPTDSPVQSRRRSRFFNVHPDGESKRRGFHPLRFFQVCFHSGNSVSKWVNLLWPVVPVAIALHYARPEWHMANFILNYIAMIPAANLIGFAGQQLARKIHNKPLGVIIEITLGSLVELILFVVLLTERRNDSVRIIRAAILGSILANMLLCLGACFIAGDASTLRRKHADDDEGQSFNQNISETGSGLLFVAGVALVVPSVFTNSLDNIDDFGSEALKISRATAIILLITFCIWTFFQIRTHHGILHETFEEDEARDADRTRDLRKPKLTLIECFIAIAVAVACVSLIAVALVKGVDFLVQERGIHDAFLGLILVPLVEKVAEHLTAIDEAYDGQMNFALAHVLGASIQTAFLITPLIILIGWGIGVHMDLDFEIFDSAVLILSIIAVGSFLRDGKSNYLEGTLCIMVYVIIAVAAFYYPNLVPADSTDNIHGGGTVGHRGAKWIEPTRI